MQWRGSEGDDDDGRGGISKETRRTSCQCVEGVWRLLEAMVAVQLFGIDNKSSGGGPDISGGGGGDELPLVVWELVLSLASAGSRVHRGGRMASSGMGS